jgi:uncharacterized protein (TIGR00730 family)
MKKASIPDHVKKKVYPSATEGVADAKRYADTPQTRSPSYRLAFADDAWLLRDEMRPVRLQLEFQKPESIQQREGIESTIVVFGSSRLMERSQAEARLKKAEEALAARPGEPAVQREAGIARRRVENSVYYEQARELGRLVSSTCQVNGLCNFVVTTGGGPGIMEAANRGAYDVGSKSVGLNIVLPHEQNPNPFITPELCFQFHYFALRKMHFLMRAKALICFPGGFGTFDELFEALTLIQTKKVAPIPVLLFGRAFWEKAVNFDFLIEEGTISPEDAKVFHFVETAEEAWAHICTYYQVEFHNENNQAPAPV